MTIKHALARLAASWLLAGCASFGEGLARITPTAWRA
jgi:hypothetical protein